MNDSMEMASTSKLSQDRNKGMVRNNIRKSFSHLKDFSNDNQYKIFLDSIKETIDLEKCPEIAISRSCIDKHGNL